MSPQNVIHDRVPLPTQYPLQFPLIFSSSICKHEIPSLVSRRKSTINTGWSVCEQYYFSFFFFVQFPSTVLVLTKYLTMENGNSSWRPEDTSDLLATVPLTLNQDFYTIRIPFHSATENGMGKVNSGTLQ